MNEKLAQYLKGYESKYPHQLEAQFGRILDRIVELWETPEMEGYFSNLMFGSGRSNRRGFPAEVATEIFILSLAYEEIRKKPAADDAEDVWAQEGHHVTLSLLNARPCQAKPAEHSAPAHPEARKARSPPKTIPIAPEFDQTLIADNLLSRASEAPAEEAEHRARQVQVSLGDHHYTWDTSGVPFTMGRDRSSNVLLTGEYASRLHARIEIRDRVVFLIDQSSNGTYVTLTGEKELFLNKGEIQLQPASSGILSFGISQGQAASELLYFTIR
ncbi:MAG: FHA domain-containing protein [Propionivibrio sp.]|uniref:FHA domain-containing protein n=1 Tax=Candidatus Propionivibrio dominans TaxID=2954373 RepID=A0A9D7IDZ9_9RHOO|nr:FHA domain-containing protein [Candidatus Propionivibrio dominans]